VVLQATPQAVAMTIRGGMQRDPNAPVFGIMRMFHGFKKVLAAEPCAAPLLRLFERGPQD
jgi:hypothetical protein